MSKSGKKLQAGRRGRSSLGGEHEVQGIRAPPESTRRSSIPPSAATAATLSVSHQPQFTLLTLVLWSYALARRSLRVHTRGSWLVSTRRGKAIKTRILCRSSNAAVSTVTTRGNCTYIVFSASNRTKRGLFYLARKANCGGGACVIYVSRVEAEDLEGRLFNKHASCCE